mmetsp:Transcript_66995/g.143282  ORF Transcript_66995/g.143282 Transcript_66995/m.143282 type:complete len:210 (-) Transcript_66995:1423-2052(-)
MESPPSRSTQELFHLTKFSVLFPPESLLIDKVPLLACENVVLAHVLAKSLLQESLLLRLEALQNHPPAHVGGRFKNQGLPHIFAARLLVAGGKTARSSHGPQVSTFAAMATEGPPSVVFVLLGHWPRLHRARHRPLLGGWTLVASSGGRTQGHAGGPLLRWPVRRLHPQLYRIRRRFLHEVPVCLALAQPRQGQGYPSGVKFARLHLRR